MGTSKNILIEFCVFIPKILETIVKMLWVGKNEYFYVRGKFVQKTILNYVTF